MRAGYHGRIPLTRLLFDSNFVSMTDMIARNRRGVQHKLMNEIGPR